MVVESGTPMAMREKKKGQMYLKKVDDRCRGVYRESGREYRIAGNGFDFIV